MSNYDATSDCIWQELDKINGWFTREEAICMQWIMKQLPPESKIVELGSFQGRSSIMIASALSTDSILYCIDNFSESLGILSAFMNNIAEYKVNNKIRFLIMDTIEAAKEFEDKSIEIVFLNTNHSYESVKQDLLQWCPKIRMGGFLICNDFTSPDHPEVREAINALQLNGTLLCGSLWCGQKS